MSDQLLSSRQARKGQARMAMGMHGLPKVSPEPAITNPSTPYVSRVARPQRLVVVFYPFGYPMPYGPAGKAALSS
jgi:hypothetical protein